jgi:hypothetical protein
VIVCDLNIVDVSGFPNEANPILIVDPDAVLPFTVSGKLFQAVARWNTQVVQGYSGI